MPDPHLAEDAVMEIFETLSRKLRSHHVANFKSWLHTVARNHCLEYLRKSKKFKHASFSNELMHSLEISHQEYKSEPIENLDTLQGCMEKLDQKQRTSIELFYLEGNSYDEVAQLMEEEKNRVRSYLQNGRRNLRNCINEANGK